MYPLATQEEFKAKNYRTTVLIRRAWSKRVLLIHGIACTKEIWFLYPLIFPEHTFVAYDLRGFGTGVAEDGNYHFERYVDDAHAIVKKYKPNLIVGHSFGGAIAQRLSHITGIPAVVMQTAATPPEEIKKVEYAKFMKMEIMRAARENLPNYFFIPFSLAYLLPLTMFNPAMPAMQYLDELTDFSTLCPEDDKVIRVMGGLRDTVIKREEVERLAECSHAKPIFADVNHAGFMYPDFVYQSLGSI